MGPSRHLRQSAAALLLHLPITVGACASDEYSAIPGTQPRVDFSDPRDLYAAPFPGEHLRLAGGRIGLAAFPNPGRVELVDRAREVIEASADGFGLTSAIHFSFTGPLDPARLPGVHESVEPASTVFLTAVTEDAPNFGRRHPIRVAFSIEPGPFGAPNLLSLLPVQGLPLRPRTLYAAVVLRALGDGGGAPLGVPDTIARLLGGIRPEGLTEQAFLRWRQAIEALAELGAPLDGISGLTVFETGDPAASMTALFERAEEEPRLRGPFEPAEVFEEYCVFTSTVTVPDYQSGEPPFSSEGGEILWDPTGRPIVQREADARIVLTIPRTAMPARGYPAAVFIRTGGGGDRPLVDRGVHAENHGPSIAPGAGPALHFARAGFAGVSLDGPHGGLRNPTGADEQFLVFNVFNPVALRDNLRESALELAKLPDLLATVELDLSTCPGAGAPRAPGRLDPESLAIMGHSMGATIAPLTLAVQPAYRAVILSGAGGSWIENIVHKESPLVVRDLARVVLGYEEEGRTLGEHDPALSLVQWAGESADPPIYGAAILPGPAGSPPRHVLMFQGIVDTYILPPIANATTLALGLDLAAPAREGSLPELLGLAGRSVRPLPITQNLPRSGEAPATGAVVQHEEDGIEDGHEVVFQRAAPKRQYRCFLETLRAGAPRIVAGLDGVSPTEEERAPCP